MSGKVPGLSITRLSAAAVGQDVLVKLDTNGKVTTAGLGDNIDGVSLNKTTAAGQEQAVAIGAGIYNLQASGAITANDTVQAAASGKVSKFNNQTALVFTAANASETFTAAGHGFVAADAVKLYLGVGGAVPTGLTVGVVYYVGGISGNDFFLYDTAANAVTGGATGKVAISGDGTAPMFFTRFGTFYLVGKAIETAVDGQWIGIEYKPERLDLGL